MPVGIEHRRNTEAKVVLAETKRLETMEVNNEMRSEENNGKRHLKSFRTMKFNYLIVLLEI